MLTLNYLMRELFDMYHIIIESWEDNSQVLYEGVAYGCPEELRDCPIRYMYAIALNEVDASIVFQIEI